MNHPAELALHQYMDNAVKGDSTMSEDYHQSGSCRHIRCTEASVWWGN